MHQFGVSLHLIPSTCEKQDVWHTFACRTGKCSCGNIPHAYIRAPWSQWVIYFFTMATNKPPIFTLSLSVHHATHSNEEASLASQVVHPLCLSLSASLHITPTSKIPSGGRYWWRVAQEDEWEKQRGEDGMEGGVLELGYSKAWINVAAKCTLD